MSADGHSSETRAAVESNPLWYHTLDLGHGLVTNGWFDLRPIADSLPWPDVKGKRCLDVGTYDGFIAFELERRGAAEVVATDVSDHSKWDWPPDVRTLGPKRLAEIAGPEKGLGFRIAKEALASSVEKQEISVYDLSPETVGEFDVVTCGALMLHLRDPLRALEAIRSVCRGEFLSAEEIDLGLTVRAPRRAIARLDGSGALCQWWIPSAAGHRRMLYAAGFEVVRATRPYTVRFGPAHPPPRRGGLRDAARGALVRLAAGAEGVPYHAALARPRV